MLWFLAHCQPGSYYHALWPGILPVLILPSHFLLTRSPGIPTVFNPKVQITNCEMQVLASEASLNSWHHTDPVLSLLGFGKWFTYWESGDSKVIHERAVRGHGHRASCVPSYGAMEHLCKADRRKHFLSFSATDGYGFGIYLPSILCGNTLQFSLRHLQIKIMNSKTWFWNMCYLFF